MVKKAEIADVPHLAELALQLWPEHEKQELEAEFRQGMQQGSTHVFLKWLEDSAVGFAQCGLRQDYVEGTSTSPVGYLEGIFVLPEYRGRGFARELTASCEAWAKAQGCWEFASDCELTNLESLHFHKALGFSEANRIICFVKKL